MKIRPLFALAFLALAGVVLAGTEGGPRFSRSRWIAARRDQVHFDGGLLPARLEDFPAVLEPSGGRTAAQAESLPGPPNVRVSLDILPPDSSTAQAETEAEAFVAVDPLDRNTLLAGYQQDRFADGGARGLTAALSHDGGRSWTEQLLPGLTQASGGAFERASDPWVAWSDNGRAYFVSLAFNESTPHNGVFVSASSNGGATWGPPSAVHVSDQDLDDKEAIAVDNAPDSPFHGRVHVGWDTVTAGNLQTERMAFSRDGGATWSAPHDLSSDGANLGVIPLVGPGGRTFAIWVCYHGNIPSILVARSFDGGETWSSPTPVAVESARGVNGLRSGDGLPTATVDPKSGALYVAWTDDRFTPGTDQIVLSSSHDSGATWNGPQRVSDGPDDAPAFTPALAVNSRGQVGIAYFTLRNDPDRRFTVDEYLSVSDSHGVFRSQRMSTQSFDVRFAAVASGFFLGDYQGLVAVGTGFRPIWIATGADSRLHPGAKQPDAYGMALVPLGVP